MPKELITIAKELYGPDICWRYAKTPKGGIYIALFKGSQIEFSWIGTKEHSLIKAFVEHIHTKKELTKEDIVE